MLGPLVILLCLGAAPAFAQEAIRSPFTPGGEIRIPSEKTLDEDAASKPRNDFSTNDGTALRQMEKREREIDRAVERGICTGC